MNMWIGFFVCCLGLRNQPLVLKGKQIVSLKLIYIVLLWICLCNNMMFWVILIRSVSASLFKVGFYFKNRDLLESYGLVEHELLNLSEQDLIVSSATWYFFWL